MNRAALLVPLFLASTFLGATAGEAQILSSFDSPSVFGSQDNSLGYAFSSSQSRSITALGFWDNNSDGFSSNHQVGLWDDAGTLLGLVNLSQGTSNTLIDGFRYADLASSVSLTAGATYFLAGTTLGDDWVYQATNITMGAGFTYLGSYFAASYGGGGLAEFPDAFAPDREYMTVNALFADVAVPEPSSLALLGVGIAGLGVIARRRRVA